MPEFEFATADDNHRYVSKRWQECNYLQALEGGIDPNHVAFLHSDEIKQDPGIATEHGSNHWQQGLEAKLEVEPSQGGMIIAYGRLSGGDDRYYWRVQQFVMPNFTLIPPFEDHPVHGHFWVPINDRQCWAWTFDYHPTRELTSHEVEAFQGGRRLHTKVMPGTYKPVANKANDCLMDRDKQRAGIHYSVIESIAMQDAWLQESMGAIYVLPPATLKGA